MNPEELTRFFEQKRKEFEDYRRYHCCTTAKGNTCEGFQNINRDFFGQALNNTSPFAERYVVLRHKNKSTKDIYSNNYRNLCSYVLLSKISEPYTTLHSE